MTGFPHGETVTLVRRVLNPSSDAYGNDQYDEHLVEVENCPVWPTGSTETTQGADQLTSGLTVMLPASTDVTAVDAVIVRGLRYEIDGEPARYESPFTGLNPGVEVHLTRVTG